MKTTKPLYEKVNVYESGWYPAFSTGTWNSLGVYFLSQDDARVYAEIVSEGRFVTREAIKIGNVYLLNNSEIKVEKSVKPLLPMIKEKVLKRTIAKLSLTEGWAVGLTNDADFIERQGI